MDTINKPCHCEPVLTLAWQSPGSSGHHRKNNVIANQSADWRGNPPVLPGALRKGAHWCGPFQGFPPVTIPRFFRELPCNTCHCEPVRRLVWQSPRYSNIFIPKPEAFTFNRGIATPSRRMVRNDTVFSRLAMTPSIFPPVRNDTVFSRFAMTSYLSFYPKRLS